MYLALDVLRMRSSHGNLLVGIFERAPTSATRTSRAPHDCELAIQFRAEMPVDQAQRDETPWLRERGEPIQGNVEGGRQRAVTVACYRDLYGIDATQHLAASSLRRETGSGIASSPTQRPLSRKHRQCESEEAPAPQQTRQFLPPACQKRSCLVTRKPNTHIAAR